MKHLESDSLDNQQLLLMNILIINYFIDLLE